MSALGYVNNMDNAPPFSAGTYAKAMTDMINDEMYWGGRFDHQQKYVDVYHIYAGLRDGSMSIQSATRFLTGIRHGQLLPWLEEDLTTLKDQWHAAAVMLPEPAVEAQGIAALFAVAWIRALRGRNRRKAAGAKGCAGRRTAA